MGNDNRLPGHTYGNTAVSDHATVIQGNVYGTVNIQNPVLFLPTPIIRDKVPLRRVERHNRIYQTHTSETITTFDEGEAQSERGASQQTVLKWEKQETLGVGLFGIVHREHCIDGAVGKSRAVKVLRLRQLQHLKVDYKKEVGALITLSQPQYIHRFIEFFCWYEDEDNVYLSMEYVACGDLVNHIGDGIDEQSAKEIGYQVLDGIKVMHHLDIIHRDIKPDNVFVVRREPTWWVKIGDFSICKSTFTQHTTLHTNIGTVGYQAPEIARFVETEKQNQYNGKCDVWSYGCLLYKMLTGSVPFPDQYDLLVYCRDNSNFPAGPLTNITLSAHGKTFIRELLQPKPADRMTAKDALERAMTWFGSSTDGKTMSIESLTNHRGEMPADSSGRPWTVVQPSKAHKQPFDTASASHGHLPQELDTSQDASIQGAHSDIKDVRYETRALRYALGRKAPLVFKDALGRTYNFPWHTCRKWSGMKKLICQAFEHIERLGAHVLQGHYDLFDPQDKPIKPNMWDQAVYPGIRVRMEMHPLSVGKNGKVGPNLLADPDLDSVIEDTDPQSPTLKKARRRSKQKPVLREPSNSSFPMLFGDKRTKKRLLPGQAFSDRAEHDLGSMNHDDASSTVSDDEDYRHEVGFDKAGFEEEDDEWTLISDQPDYYDIAHGFQRKGLLYRWKS